jgi:hypothetical protein
MATCTVCGDQLPAQQGPRARVYCSRACQAKAYRARQQQHAGHQAATADVPALLAEYDGTTSRQLADSLAAAAERVATNLSAGLPADDHDLGVLTRIPVVLTARARQAAPSAEAVHGRPDATTAPTVAAVDLAEQPTTPQKTRRPAARASRDASARRRRRRYTTEQINDIALRATSEGSWEAVLAGDVIGRVQHRYASGRRQGWEATTLDLMKLTHRGAGTYAKTRDAALLDLLRGLDIRPA